jgi:hypothetical protein
LQLGHPGLIKGTAARGVETARERRPVAGVGEVAAEVVGDVAAGVGFGALGLVRAVGAMQGAVSPVAPAATSQAGATGGSGSRLLVCRVMGSAPTASTAVAIADVLGGRAGSQPANYDEIHGYHRTPALQRAFS